MTPAPVSLSDQELVRLVHAGSWAPFEELVRRHEGRLLRFLRRRVGNAHDAEDLLQETFARALGRIELYRPQWPFGSWLFSIAHRLAINHFRRARPREPLAAGAAVSRREDDPSEAAERREEHDRLWATARRALTDDQYVVLWLRYVEEMPTAEIARVVGKTVTHVKVILHRARGRLIRATRTAEVPAAASEALRRAEEGA